MLHGPIQWLHSDAWNPSLTFAEKKTVVNFASVGYLVESTLLVGMGGQEASTCFHLVCCIVQHILQKSVAPGERLIIQERSPF